MTSIVPAVLQSQQVQRHILLIRGEQVLLDRDLAVLYGVDVRVLNQAVKRNKERFPKEFMFQLDNQEFMEWRSQFVISNSDKMGLRRAPYAFTEQGVAMLSAVLKSPTAIAVSIGIMNAFVEMRKMVTEQKQSVLDVEGLRLRLERLEDAVENNLGSLNDLSEEVRQEVDNIYAAIGELSVRQHQLEEHPKPKMKPIGYDV